METQISSSYFKNYKKLDGMKVDGETINRLFYSHEFIINDKLVTAISPAYKHIHVREILEGDIEKGKLKLGKQSLIGYKDVLSSKNIKVYKKA